MCLRAAAAKTMRTFVVVLSSLTNVKYGRNHCRIFFLLWYFCNVSPFLLVFDGLIIGFINFRVFSMQRLFLHLHSRQRQLVVIIKIWFAASPWDSYLVTPFFSLFDPFCMVKAFSSQKVDVWLADLVIPIDSSSQRLLCKLSTDSSLST